MSYDSSCYALAKEFLDDRGWSNTADYHRLAQEIQNVIEDFVADLENEMGKVDDHTK